jgi:D-alanyl-D-alanine carboxypeptidase
MNSQNGWPVLGTLSPMLVRTSIPGVPGVRLPGGVRRGAVSVVLFFVAGEFHRTVEPLWSGWCWGYARRRIAGSAAWSNHASGTAIDLNAPRHPMGVRGTFTPARVQAIRRILDVCDGCVRWGGDYSVRADEMHFEINRPAAAVKELAARLTTRV